MKDLKFQLKFYILTFSQQSAMKQGEIANIENDILSVGKCSYYIATNA